MVWGSLNGEYPFFFLHLSPNLWQLYKEAGQQLQWTLTSGLRGTTICFQKALDKTAVCVRASSNLLGKLCLKEALWFTQGSRVNFCPEIPQKGFPQNQRILSNAECQVVSGMAGSEILAWAQSCDQGWASLLVCKMGLVNQCSSFSCCE